ncbi:MAG TPA: hypothetical protein VG734_20875 [Lacunisphaera sp.]|nr:hypothetical protein [Lacunisphaera sp.]
MAFAASPPAGFFERITLIDFQVVETNNDLVLSPTHQLVISFPNIQRAGAVDRAVALRRIEGGKWLLTHFVAAPPRQPGQFRREDFELDPVIARHVLAIANHLLGANGSDTAGPLRQPAPDDDAWMFARGDRTVATAVASNQLLQRGTGEDVAIYRDLCAGLFGIFVAPEERNQVIKQLDRLTVRYVKLKQLVRD